MSDVLFPKKNDLTFYPKDFVEPGPQPSADMSIFLVGYGSFGKDAPVKCYVFREYTSGLVELAPIEFPTSGRGSLTIGGAGKRLWLYSYEGPRLIKQVVPGWTPPAWLIVP